MEWTTNSGLLERLRRFDDASAWGSLVECFRGPIEGYALRSGLGREDARDAAQDALVAFAQSYAAGNYDRSRGRLKHWLLGIARRQIVARRREAAAAEACRSDTHEPAVGDACDPLWEDEWRRSILERSLAQVAREVNAETFELFRRVALDGVPVDEIVEQLGVPRTRVYNAKHRVAARLRELVQHYDDA
jgi:RNA polymerase sigma factor (sigma-70 family)